MKSLLKSRMVYARLRSIRNRITRTAMRLAHVHATSYVHRSASASGDLTTEEYVFVGPNCDIGPRTFIGRYSMLAQNVLIIGGDHVTDAPGVPMQFSGRPSTGETSVGRDVWIGARSIIIRGVSIGEGSIIAAGAVVTRDVEPYAIVAGVPARKIGERFTEQSSRKKHSQAINGTILPPTFASKLI